MNRVELNRLEELLNTLAAGRPTWQAQAACRGSGVSFFPERGDNHLPALRLCESCPVRDECREWGCMSVTASSVASPASSVVGSAASG